MLSLRKAALVAGIGKSKLQRDAKAGLVSYTQNEKGFYQFDEAEIARAYPDTYKTEDQRKSETGRPEPYVVDTKGRKGTSAKSTEDRLKLALLQKEVEHLKDKLEMVTIERKNEREILEREAERLSESLKAAEQDRAATTRMLEDKREEKPRNKRMMGWLKRAGW